MTDLTCSLSVFDLPISHRHCTFDNYEWQSEALQGRVTTVLSAMEQGTAPHLLLLGNPGNGKTHLAVSIYRWAILRFGTLACKFIVVPQFCSIVKEQFNAPDPENLFADVRDATSLIVLDDLLGRSLSPWELDNVIYPIINTAYSNGATLVATANQTLAQIGEILKPHEVSRLVDNAQVLQFSGVDRRMV